MGKKMLDENNLVVKRNSGEKKIMRIKDFKWVKQSGGNDSFIND